MGVLFFTNSLMEEDLPSVPLGVDSAARGFRGRHAELLGQANQWNSGVKMPCAPWTFVRALASGQNPRHAGIPALPVLRAAPSFSGEAVGDKERPQSQV